MLEYEDRQDAIDAAIQHAKHNADGRCYVDKNRSGKWFIMNTVPLLKTLNARCVNCYGKVDLA